MSEFKTELDIKLIKDDKVWWVDSPLVYQSDLLNATITVPKGFQTDLASVPRVPIAYIAFGGRAHRESVIHDYLFRIDSCPVVTFMQANKTFLEAMKVRGKSLFVRMSMYAGVCVGGYFLFHKKKVQDDF